MKSNLRDHQKSLSSFYLSSSTVSSSSISFSLPICLSLLYFLYSSLSSSSLSFLAVQSIFFLSYLSDESLGWATILGSLSLLCRQLQQTIKTMRTMARRQGLSRQTHLAHWKVVKDANSRNIIFQKKEFMAQLSWKGLSWNSWGLTWQESKRERATSVRKAKKRKRRRWVKACFRRQNIDLYANASIVLRLNSLIKSDQNHNNIIKQMEVNCSFAGMTLTEIFEIQSLQSLFIKFWYLGLTAQSIVAPEDAALFKAIRKNISFANCFTFEMPLKTYMNFNEKILQALAAIEPRKTFQILLGHLRNNKVISVSFELFGVAFLQLFGRILELLSTQTMNKVLRKIFLEITVLGKVGVSSLKTKNIKPITFDDLIPNFNDLLQQTANQTNSIRPNPQNMPAPISSSRQDVERDYDMKTLKGRFEGLREIKAEHREMEGEHYPPGEKLRSKDKANISCFMMGGFEIVDYSDSINQLHKKLLTKIMLNK